MITNDDKDVVTMANARISLFLWNARQSLHDADVDSGTMTYAMEDPLAKEAPSKYALKMHDNSSVAS